MRSSGARWPAAGSPAAIARAPSCRRPAAPTGFRVTVGAHVPDSVELKPLSDTLAKVAPQAKDFSVAMIEKQVILVDPGNRQVVAVVTQEPANEVR